MTYAREPRHDEMADLVVNEIRSDAPIIAEALFADQKIHGSHEVSKTDFLTYWRQAWTRGVNIEGQGYVTPMAWRAQALHRWGAERFLELAHEAFSLPAPRVADEPRMTLEGRTAEIMADMGASPEAVAGVLGGPADGEEA